MKKSYPVIMTQGSEHIVVYVPDFDINTQGADTADALKMARDAIAIVGIDMLEDGEQLPCASGVEKVRKNAQKGSIVILVDVDFEGVLKKK